MWHTLMETVTQGGWAEEVAINTCPEGQTGWKTAGKVSVEV